MASDPPTTPATSDDRVRPLFVHARDLVELLNAGPPMLVDAAELARLLAVSVATLHRLRSAGKIGPRPLPVGGRVLWRRETVESWLVESEHAGELLTIEQWAEMRGNDGGQR